MFAYLLSIVDHISFCGVHVIQTLTPDIILQVEGAKDAFQRLVEAWRGVSVYAR